MDDEQTRFYRRRLPHWREAGSFYFVTWRLAKGQSKLAPEERTIVADAVLHFNDERYELVTFVVMNNHVHVIVAPEDQHQLESIVASWKSFSSHQIQQRRRRSGALWQREYFDRIIRDEKELDEKIEYVRTNPFQRWPELETYQWVWPQEE